MPKIDISSKEDFYYEKIVAAAEKEELEDLLQLTIHELTLLEIHKNINKKPICRKCGCTDNNCSMCIEKTGIPCRWIENDLCSACTTIEDMKPGMRIKLYHQKDFVYVQAVNLTP